MASRNRPIQYDMLRSTLMDGGTSAICHLLVPTL